MGLDSRFNITASIVSHNRRQLEPAFDRRGRLAYVESYDGRADLYVLDRHVGWPRQVTTYPRPKSAMSYLGGLFTWTSDGTTLVYVAEDGQLWSVPDVGGPASRLTDLPGRCSAPAVGPSGSWICFVYQTEERSDVVIGSVGGDWIREGDLLRLNRSDFAFDPCWSPSGSWVVWHEWDIPSMPWDSGRIVAARPDGTERTMVDEGPHGVAQPRFSPDGRYLAYLSERSGWVNLWIAETGIWIPRQLVLDEAEHGLPPWRPRVRTFAWSPDGSRIVFARNQGGRQSLRLVGVPSGIVEPLAVPGTSFESLDWGQEIVAVVSSSDLPRSVVVMEPDGRAELVADDGLGIWEALDLAAAEPVRFPGADGRDLYGILWKPVLEGPRPLVLLCHGGPNGQIRDEWVPLAQYLVERGYAVLAPNFRGSTGYGSRYRDALLGRWGEVDVEDASAAITWAVQQGIAAPDRVVAWGGSAGGYLVLMLLAKHGDQLAGGIDLFGVTDLEQLASITHRFEAHYLDRLVGPLPVSKRRYEERSPISLVNQMRKPVLILQGDEDVAVPVSQSRAIHDALIAAGVSSELVVYEGEGHGLRRIDNIVDSYRRIEDFLERIGAAESEQRNAGTAHRR
jgi:dipeptidyl aminopeptidase/acylaminoacyl peptidase